MSILAQLSHSPMISLLLFLLLLLYAMSSSTPAILDHEVLESDHNEYEVTFEGHTLHTLLTYSPSIASSWLSSHSFEQLVVGSSRGSEHLIVGLDIEWLAGPEGVRNLAAILQVLVGVHCLIFQLLYSSEIPRPSKTSLATTATSSSASKPLHGLDVNNTRDLRSLANNAGLEVPQDCGLKVLAKLILGWKMEKQNQVTVSQWNKLWLTSAQVRYACMDAFVALQIGKALYAA